MDDMMHEKTWEKSDSPAVEHASSKMRRNNSITPVSVEISSGCFQGTRASVHVNEIDSFRVHFYFTVSYATYNI